MNNSCVCVLILFPLLLLSAAGQSLFGPNFNPIEPIDQPIQLGKYKASAGTILVKAKNDVTSQKKLANLIANNGYRIHCSYSTVPGLQCLAFKPVQHQENLEAKIAELQETGAFHYVEADWIVQAYQTPTDSRFVSGELWGLRNTGQNGGTSGVDVQAVDAWSVTTGSRDVIVGVIDTGVRYTHQDLRNNMWRNPGEIANNGIDDDSNGYVDDVFGINAINNSGNPFDDGDHGSHVSGTIAATANDSGGHVGVAYNVRIMALKFLAGSGGGATSDAIQCIDYGVSEGAQILNNSWGGGAYSQSLADSIEAANQAGVLFLAAAGNSTNNNDDSDNWPSNYPSENVVAVAAIDRSGDIASFSSYGVTTVDIAGPGVDVYSCTSSSDSSYAVFSGTSMATPHVAGVAALLKSQYPDSTLAELKARLYATASPLNSLNGVVATGGTVAAHDALLITEDGDLDLRVQGLIKKDSSSVIRATVSDLYGVPGATVTGMIVNGASLTFRDNGFAPDAVANDGIYAATITYSGDEEIVSVNVSATAPGKTAASGTFVLPVVRPPENNDFEDRTIIGVGTLSEGTNVLADQQSGEPLNPSVSGGKSVWWSWTPTRNGTASISTSGSNFDTTLAVYTGDALNNLRIIAANDDAGSLQSTVNFSAVLGQVYAIQVDGYRGAEGNILLSYPSPGAAIPGAPYLTTQPTSRRIFEGSPLTLFVTVGGDDPLNYQWSKNGIELTDATERIFTIPSVDLSDQGNYSVKITNSFGDAESNPANIFVVDAGLIPPNDDFSNAQEITGLEGRITGTNAFSRGEPAELNHARASFPLASVWYQYVAPKNGRLRVDTIGSDFDTTLGIYQGELVYDLTILANNDDGAGEQSIATINVIEGDLYYFAVDGSGSAEGNITLNYILSPEADRLPQDFWSERGTIPSSGGSATASNIGATSEMGEDDHGGASAPIESIWWSWTPDSGGVVTIDTLGSDFDTILSIYRGSNLSDLTEVASNDDTSGNTSQVSFEVVAGVEYSIAVDGMGPSAGQARMTVVFEPLELTPQVEGSRILLVDDQDGFGTTRDMLENEGQFVTMITNEARNNYPHVGNPLYLANFDFVIYAERGSFGSGSRLPQVVADVLEDYIQNGGHLLVTGFDTIAGPNDEALANLCRLSMPSDIAASDPVWAVSAIDHPILNGPFIDLRGAGFLAQGYDSDRATPDTSRGAVELVAIGAPRKTSKIVLTDLPARGGSVGYWNGGLRGTDTVPQPDFVSGGATQSAFLNWVEWALPAPNVDPVAVLHVTDLSISTLIADSALEEIRAQADTMILSNPNDALPTYLGSYDCVLLTLGSGDLSEANQIRLTTYLESGGRVLLTGNGFGFATETSELLGITSTLAAISSFTLESRNLTNLVFSDPDQTVASNGSITGAYSLEPVTDVVADAIGGYGTDGASAIMSTNSGRALVNGFALLDFPEADAAALLTRELNSLLYGYSGWQSRHFDDDTEDSSSLADPDGDGLNNYFEYALNLNPTLANQSPLNVIEINGGLMREVSFTRPLNGRPGVTYHLMFSTDLDFWTEMTTTSEVLPNGLERMTATSGSERKGFYQLEIR